MLTYSLTTIGVRVHARPRHSCERELSHVALARSTAAEDCVMFEASVRTTRAWLQRLLLIVLGAIVALQVLTSDLLADIVNSLLVSSASQNSVS
jgi:hypothetical protein